MGKVQILDSLVKALKLPEEESGMQGEGSQRRKSASFCLTSYTALRFVQSALLGLKFTVLCCLFMFHCQDFDINIKYYNYHWQQTCQPEVKVTGKKL